MSLEEHRRHAFKEINFIIVITTDTRDEKSDISGRIMREMIEDTGYNVISTYFVKNNIDEIKKNIL